MSKLINYQPLENGKVMVNGVELTIEELAGTYVKHQKTASDMIHKTAATEQSRSKREHRQAEYARIVESDPELLERVAPFTKTLEDFIPRATELVNAGKGQRT